MIVMCCTARHLDYEDLLSLARSCTRMARMFREHANPIWRHCVEGASKSARATLWRARERAIKWRAAEAIYHKEEEREKGREVVEHGEEEEQQVEEEGQEQFPFLVTTPAQAWLGPIDALMDTHHLSEALAVNSTTLSYREQARLFSLAKRDFSLACSSCKNHIITLSLDIFDSFVSNDDVIARRIQGIYDDNDIDDDFELDRPVCYVEPLFRVDVGTYELGPNVHCPNFRLSSMVWSCDMDQCGDNVTCQHEGAGCCGESNSLVHCASCTQSVGLYSNDCCGGVYVSLSMSHCIIIGNDDALWKARVIFLAMRRKISLL